MKGRAAGFLLHTSLVIALFAAPLAAVAQPARTPLFRVAILDTASFTARDRTWSAFHERLRELGYAEGQNIALEKRSADGRTERLRDLAAELTALGVDVIVTLGTPAAAAPRKRPRRSLSSWPSQPTRWALGSS